MEDIKVIVAGGRNFTDYELMKVNLNFYIAPGIIKRQVEIVSGRCDKGTLTFTTDDGIKVYGADGLGEKYAKEYGFKVVPFPPDKSKGKKGYYIRNKQMADYGNRCVAFWDNKSPGTKMMIGLAKDAGLRTKIITY